MADKKLFQSAAAKAAIDGIKPAELVRNQAGGLAYNLSDKAALAQYAATGCFGSTFYASGEDQIDAVKVLLDKCDAEFVAKTAIFMREKGFMKDMPAFLITYLAGKGKTDPKYAEVAEKAFPRVIDNGKMLRNFCQMIRSGSLGRKSFGERYRRLINNWLREKSATQILKASVGNDPSLLDIIKMNHPKPKDEETAQLYRYLLGKKDWDRVKAPAILRELEDFKLGKSDDIPAVAFQLLTALDLTEDQWKVIACRMPWHATRMNLNTFQRHNVFSAPALVNTVAEKLKDAEKIRKAKAFPYQLYSAFNFTKNTPGMPPQIIKALEEAMEHAISNVPTLEGQKIVVCVDVSGSMSVPVTGTGKNGGPASQISCREVASLIAAAVIRRNPDSRIIGFATDAAWVHLTGLNTVFHTMDTLSRLPSGGTDCSAPLRLMNKTGEKPDMVIFASDNQSWIENRPASIYAYGNSHTDTVREWETLKKRHPTAKMVCIDLAPSGTTQVQERKDVMNVGSFSDLVFTAIADFATGKTDAHYRIKQIEEVVL